MAASRDETAALRAEVAALRRRLTRREAECRELTEDLDFAEASARVWRRKAEQWWVEVERLRMHVAALEQPED